MIKIYALVTWLGRAVRDEYRYAHFSFAMQGHSEADDAANSKGLDCAPLATRAPRKHYVPYRLELAARK